jgi:hypothetical protein
MLWKCSLEPPSFGELARTENDAAVSANPVGRVLEQKENVMLVALAHGVQETPYQGLDHH